MSVLAYYLDMLSCPWSVQFMLPNTEWLRLHHLPQQFASAPMPRQVVDYNTVRHQRYMVHNGLHISISSIEIVIDLVL